MNQENQPDQEELLKLEKEFKKNLSVSTFMALPFLALNHYDALFTLVYMVIAIGLLAYKQSIYPLPNYALICEGIILVMLALTQLLRYNLAEKTIKYKQVSYGVLYLVGTIFVLLSLIFELRLQTYVVLAEVITNWIGIVFIIL